MPRLSAEHQQRIEAAIRAHESRVKSTGKGALSAAAYAQAAGISEPTARRILRAIGIPFTGAEIYKRGPAPPKPPPESRIAKAAPAESQASPEAAQQEKPQSTSPWGVSPLTPPVDSEVVQPLGELAAALVRFRADVQGLPSAVVKEAEQVMGLHAEALEATPEELRAKTARKEVSRVSQDHVVDKATAIQTYIEEAGWIVYHYWNDGGFRHQFPEGPGQLLRAALEAWWQSREPGGLGLALQRIDELMLMNFSLREHLAEERAFLAPERRISENTDRAWETAMLAAAAGNPLPQKEIAGLLRLASAVAITYEASPDAPALALGDGNSK